MRMERARRVRLPVPRRPDLSLSDQWKNPHQRPGRSSQLVWQSCSGGLTDDVDLVETQVSQEVWQQLSR